MLNLPASGGFDTSSVINGDAFFESNLIHPVLGTGSPDNTNGVVDILVVSRTTTGVAASGLGAGILFLLEDAAANTRQEGGRISARWIDAVAPVQSELAFSVVTAGSGAVSEVFKISTGLTFAPSAETDGARKTVLITPANHTGQTASTEISGFDYVTHTRTWSTGAIATQREFLIEAPTYAFDGASTITTAATLAVSGAPVAGTNATITNSYAALLSGRTMVNAAGSAASPAIQLVDTGLGLFQQATNSLGISTAGAERWRINASGHMLGATDNTYDIGASGATRPRSVYVGTDITTPVFRLASGTLTAWLSTISSNKVTWQAAATASVFGFNVIGSSVTTSGAHSFWTMTAMANTGQTASTEIKGFAWNAFTRQWATGALATQREVFFGAPTYAFVGASTITTAANLYADLPIAGANATITDAYAAWFAGKIRIDAAAALGGGAAATLGTIGGAGPTAAAQAEWVAVDTNNGRRWAALWQ